MLSDSHSPETHKKVGAGSYKTGCWKFRKRERNVQVTWIAIAALEKENANLRQTSQASSTSSLLDEDDPQPCPKYNVSQGIFPLNWVHSMKKY